MAKIVGNTVGIPNPQPDWEQNDPTKADYIKNKPDLSNVGNAGAGVQYTPEIGETTTLEPGSEATVEIELDEKNKIAKYSFGIPQGESGVWTRSEDPTEGSQYTVWVDPNGEGAKYLTEEEIIELLGSLNFSPSTYSLRTIANEVGTQDLMITDAATNQTILSMNFVRDNDNSTKMTVTNTQGESVDVYINDGKDYILTEDNKSEIAGFVKDIIPLSDYVKTVNGSAPDENGNVLISATIEPPQIVESLEWIEEHGETNKQYVLNGYLYAYMQQTIPAHRKPLFTNYFNIDNVRLNSFTTENGIVTAGNYTTSLYNYNPNGYIEIGTSIPFSRDDINKEHILRVVNLGYGIMANPNLIQPWIGDYHAPVSGVKIRYMSSRAEGAYCETEGGLGEQWVKIPIGVGDDSTNNNNWNDRPDLNGTRDEITGIRVSLRARISESGPLTKEDLISRNIIITLDEEIAYEDVPEETKYVWTNTGQKYGNDYSAEIEDLTKRVTEIENTDSVSVISNPNIKSINHRGYNTAPDNTLPAYKLSKQKGFEYVECDVRFTEDNVPVLYHNDTINGKAISEYTSDEIKDLRIFSDEWSDTKIPTFEEFILLCKNLGLHPYIEMKTVITDGQASILFDICKKYGMNKNCTWISFFPVALDKIKSLDSKARLGYIVSTETLNGVSGLVIEGETYITTAMSLKNAENEVFVDANWEIVDSVVGDCIINNIPLEVWTVDDVTVAAGLNPYVSGFSSDSVVIGTELLKNNLK